MLVNNVRELRINNNMTQNNLATIVVTTRKTISNIKNGKHNTSCELSIRIVHVFEKEVEDIFKIK